MPRRKKRVESLLRRQMIDRRQRNEKGQFMSKKIKALGPGLAQSTDEAITNNYCTILQSIIMNLLLNIKSPVRVVGPHAPNENAIKYLRKIIKEIKEDNWVFDYYELIYNYSASKIRKKLISEANKNIRKLKKDENKSTTTKSS